MKTQTQILLLALVVVAFSCSCKTVPVKPALSLERQALVAEVENVRAELEKALEAEGNPKVVVNKLLFTTSETPKPDVALVVLQIDDVLLGALYVGKGKNWQALSEIYSIAEGKLGIRRQALMDRITEFDANMKSDGLKFHRQNLLWASTNVDDHKDSMLMLYEIDGTQVGFAAFFINGGWVIAPERFE